jgi:hypothetical protein
MTKRVDEAASLLLRCRTLLSSPLPSSKSETKINLNRIEGKQGGEGKQAYKRRRKRR